MLLAQVRAFPWLQEMLPQLMALTPANQDAVRAVIATLAQQPVQSGDE